MKKKTQPLPDDAGFPEDPPHRPIMCVRQRMEKYFDGWTASTLANLAVQGKGPRFWKVGKLTWYDIKEAEDYLKKNPIITSEEDST